MIMTTAAFDQQVNIMLLDDGVFFLKKNQKPARAGLKDISAILKALPLYNIDTIYAETESLMEKGLTETELTGHIMKIDRKDAGTFFNQFDLIINT